MDQANLWTLSVIAGRTAIVFVFVVFGLRLLGKRQIGQMNIYDLALIMALANAVQNAMTSGSGLLAVGIVSSSTLIGAGRLLTVFFQRSSGMEKRVIGSPTILVYEGHVFSERMRRECITDAELMTALREHGVCDTDEAKLAVLEVDGTISVVPCDAPSTKKHRHFRALRLP